MDELVCRNIEKDVIRVASKVAANEIDITSLKTKQVEAITSFVAGRNTFVSLSTGYRKSVIYALLPLVFDMPVTFLFIFIFCAYQI